jgi:hypothetical protein
MGYTTDLLTGIAELLDAAGAGTWNPTGVYAADDTGITLTVIPAQPERIVCLTAYPVDDSEPGSTDVVTGVQVRFRAGRDPRDVEDMADAVYDQLQGLAQQRIGGVPVAQMWRQSSALWGADSNGRWERSDNYYVQASRATAHNTD